jgi:hypothetical protein
MTAPNFTLIDETRPTTVPATITGERIRIETNAVRHALGWELKPQGLCKADRCIPTSALQGVVHPDGIDLGALADVLGRPLALDVDERIACLGAAADDRGAQLASLEAPDFNLPDLAGRRHSLSEHRGKKVFLVAYASW